MTAPTVDVHAHVLLPQVEALLADQPGYARSKELDARRNGPAALAVSGPMVRDRLPRLTEVTERLAAMDAQGVDVQLVSPSPSHYHYWTDASTAEKVYRLANEATAAHCAQAPDRLRGLGLVPLQHPEQTVAALDHALEQGLAGVEISSHAPGRELSDPAYNSLWTRAEETGAVIFLHPFGCTLDERLDQWYLSNTVGQPTENAVALSHLIFSGVLDRHPGLKIIAAHGGGYLPTHIGRSDHAWRARNDASALLRPAPEQLSAASVLRLPGARPAGAPVTGASRRSRPGAARFRLPLRHGYGRPCRRPAVRRTGRGRSRRHPRPERRRTAQHLSRLRRQPA